MLGPALLLLFTELDGRQDDLTPYEQVLHKELEALQAGAQLGIPSELSRPPRSFARKVGGQSAAIPRRPGKISDVIVGKTFSSEGGVPQLQINCKEVNCPNKKRK